MAPHQKRVCIVGTAQSYKQTPWTDPTLEIWSLNDAYMLGLPRASRWFELHPFDKMTFRPKAQKAIRAEDIPEGYYVRPEGHIEWLKKQAETIPVYLQAAPPADWPVNARRMPIEQIHAEFGDDYWASGPSYMLALAIMEGYTEIWITGIHLATEPEYRKQRPQWENLIGRLLGRKVTRTVKDGWRIYDGDVRIVLPENCPILKHGWKYAYEHEPVAPANPYRTELKQVRVAKQELVASLVRMADGPQKIEALERLARLEIVELDCQQMLQKSHLQEAPIVAQLHVA